MKKFNVLTVLFLLFWVQICFSEEIPSDYYLSISDDEGYLNTISDPFAELLRINKKYELNLKYPQILYQSDLVRTAPYHADNGDYCYIDDCLEDFKEAETQGLANIDGKYWILSKNKWIDTFYVNKDGFFSESNSNKIADATITNDKDKNGDIDFFNGKLYAPIKTSIYVYGWDEKTRKFTKEKTYPLDEYLEKDREPFGVTIHPYSGDIFFREDSRETKSGIYGKSLSDWECNHMKLISFQNKDGDTIEHAKIGDHHWTQGMEFSPNGRFLFYVHDDSHDEWSDHTGIYIYYIDYENYEKLMNSSCRENNINAKLVSFINIKYDPDVDGCRDQDKDDCVRKDELEGLDVGGEIEGYDLRLLVLHNAFSLTGVEHHSILHFATGDYDGDGVKDIYDKCPFIPDDQADLDEDGIGDECDRDRDGDGIPNIHDNCPDDFNPDQENWNVFEDGRIKIGDACQDSDGDSWLDSEDACPEYKNNKICKENCRRSNSECCLEARKLCDDMDRDGRWDKEESPHEDFYDNYAFSVGAFWSKGGAKCEEIGQKSSKTLTLRYESCDVGYELKINNRTSYFRNMRDSDAKMSSYYCYCGNDRFSHLDCEDEDNGKCGTDHAHPGEAWNNKNSKPTWMPLYSNGEDYKDKNFEDVVAKSDRLQKTKIQHNSFYKTWSYSQDKWLKSQITGEKNPENMPDDEFFAALPYAGAEEEKEIIKNSGNYPKMKISHGAAFSDKNDYVKGEEINKLFFSNGEEYQKHITGKNEELNLASQSKDLDLIIENQIFIHGYFNFPGLGKWYWEMLRDYIGEKPWWKEDLPFARQFEDIVKESLYESISRPSLFSRVSYNGEEIKIKAVQYPENYNQIFAYAVQDGIYYQENDEFKIAFSDVNGIFRNARTVHNGFEMRSAAVTVKVTDIYMAAGMTATPGSQIRNLADSDNPAEEKPIRNRRFARIYFTNGEAIMEELAELPWTPEYITLFVSDNQIHAMMMDENGETSVLEYYSENNSWVTLNSFSFGQVFSLNNTFVKDNKLYFTAPNAEGKTAFYTWDESNSFVEIAHLDSEYDSSIKPFESAGEIILADLKDISGKSIDSWQLNGTIFEKEKISLDKPKFARKFCLNETDDSIFPGITNFYGECVKVENYDFDEVTFPDYKLSVAGYKNSLYLGGLTGIRRVEIGENGEVVKKEMIYSGESNNLAVYGNTLYAANYSEIDIFEIADDGSISRKSSVKTNNCKNIRIDGGKLFGAENKRVRIFDLSDPLSPELLKTISLTKTVEDLEIAENKLFVYENLNGLLTRKGKVSVFDISDIANPQKIKEFSQYCNDPEMQKSGNDVYLGCKNGSFKVMESGLQKMNGSKNYLREGYVFDGILYQVFSGTLHKSSVEFDEVEEDGWI